MATEIESAGGASRLQRPPPLQCQDYQGVLAGHNCASTESIFKKINGGYDAGEAVYTLLHLADLLVTVLQNARYAVQHERHFISLAAHEVDTSNIA